MTDKRASEAFESRFKNARIIWVAMTGFSVACAAIVLSTTPTRPDLTFSSPILDDNRVFVTLIVFLSISTLLGLRKKDEYASYVLDLHDTERLAIGYFFPHLIGLSIFCWGILLTSYFEYPYSFIWYVVGLLCALYVFPRRTRWEEIFSRVNADLYEPQKLEDELELAE